MASSATGDDAVVAGLADDQFGQGEGGRRPGPKGPKKQAKGGGGGGGAGDGGGRNRDMLVSKALSRLLRHQAVTAGIELDQEGYAPLEKVVRSFLVFFPSTRTSNEQRGYSGLTNCTDDDERNEQLEWGPLRSLQVTLDDVFHVTAGDAKQRFSMKPVVADKQADTDTDTATATAASDWLIRANQGHSIKVESEHLLQPITLDGTVPPTVVHGTYFAFWPRIVDSGGLRRMTRNHVHCSTGLPRAGPAGGEDASAATVISGMRHDAELLIYIDVRQSLEDGAMKWWKSDNGVVLTEGMGEEGLVPTKYFKEVAGRQQDVVGTLWKDGVWVADLPEDVKSRPPPNKGGGRGRGGGRGGGRGRERGRGRGRGRARG